MYDLCPWRNEVAYKGQNVRIAAWVNKLGKKNKQQQQQQQQQQNKKEKKRKKKNKLGNSSVKSFVIFNRLTTPVLWRIEEDLLT